MPRTRSSIEKIRAEFAWVNQPLDPNKCSVAACEAAAQPCRRLGLHNTHTATSFLLVQHPLTALPEP